MGQPFCCAVSPVTRLLTDFARRASNPLLAGIFATLQVSSEQFLQDAYNALAHQMQGQGCHLISGSC